MKKNVLEFVIIAFLLLGALFGMQIMSFIFVNLSPSSVSIPDDTITKTNITGVYINSTIYTITEASNSNFNGGFAVIQATNSSSGEVILAGNYTVSAAAGTIVNASVINWNEVNLTYSFSQKTSIRQSSESIQNDSLNAIQNYSSQAGTQFNTVGIAITLVILIALFFIFWKIFVKGKSGKGREGGNFS